MNDVIVTTCQGCTSMCNLKRIYTHYGAKGCGILKNKEEMSTNFFQKEVHEIKTKIETR